ncbi:MAG: ChaN family lipoprotein [Bacteroidales bacterium]|nr:ChaN family lipoprotein [Bacteroidales bacterium]
MKKILLTITVAFFSISLVFTQEKPSYILYNKDGEATTFSLLIESAIRNNIVLFGELHNNPISHWLQYELTKEIYERIGNRLVLGAEMFEADNQIILNEYLKGLIAIRNFQADARLWDNFETDYKPLLDFAKEKNLSFIASNIPRRYASIVNNSGFEGLDVLSNEAKRYIAPLPVRYDPNLPGYQKMLNMGGMQGRQTNENFPKAQAIKDATMAYFIVQNLISESIFLHFHGAFHSDFYDGIYWYLKQSNSNINILTISTVEQDNISSLDEEHLGRADFIICVPASMTKTY